MSWNTPLGTPQKGAALQKEIKMSSNASFKTTLTLPPDGKWNLYVVALILFIIVAALSWLSVGQASDPREPPQLKPKFPLIGHLLGILQHEAEYFQKLRLELPRAFLSSLTDFLSKVPVNDGQSSHSRSSAPVSTWLHPGSLSKPSFATQSPYPLIQFRRQALDESSPSLKTT